MRQALAKPNAMSAMAANRAAEARDQQMAHLTVVGRECAHSIADLIELVAALTARVEQLEGQR